MDLVEGNPPGSEDTLVTWGSAILDLSTEQSIEYPKVFYRRVSEARRKLDDVRASAGAKKPDHTAGGNQYKADVTYA